MKRSFKILCAMFLILNLCSMQVTGLAQTDPDAITITKIEVTQDAQDFILYVTLQNNGTAAIDEFGLALAFFDENGDRLFGYADTLEGYTQEVCNWYYTPEKTIKPGGHYLTEDVFSGYAGTAEIAVAIRYYHKADREYVLLPESEWQWLSPGYETDASGTNRTYYTSPPDALYDLIEDYDLGYSYYLLDDFNAFHYGKIQGGEWITEVTDGSPALDAGLAVGDLVLFADGMKPTENIYAVEYAMAEIVSGKKVEFVFERDGLIYTTKIPNP